jgi:uncharacterized protein
MNVTLIADLEAAMKRRLSALPVRIRPFTRSRVPLPRAFVLSGPRGIGKTTFLLHHSKGQKMLYLSADNPLLAGDGLFDIGKAIFMTGYAGLIIDEVHFARDWSQHLKALYDDFPEHRIWVSDSSSLVLRGAAGDLSRRYVPIAMPLQSFREYLFVTSGVEYPTCDPFVSDPMLPLEPKPEILAAFRDYKAQGTRPFSAEGDFSERLLAVLDKTLYSDIPFFLPSVTDGNLRLMKAIIGTLAEASIPRLQVRSLCADWGIGADKLYQLLDVMESVGLLRMLRVEGDRKAKSVGAKMFFSDPAYYEVLHGNTGTAREAMVATLCAEAGWTVEATKEEASGDFAISRREGGKLRRLMIEVGGASKRVKSADWVVRDDLDYPGGKAIPLWLLGMAY